MNIKETQKELQKALQEKAMINLQNIITNLTSSYYDANNRDYKSQKKSVPTEVQSEDKEITAYDMLEIIASARDLERNDGTTQGLIKQLKNNIVNTGVKVFANTESEEFNKKFNYMFAEWCKDCDFLAPLDEDNTGINFADFLGLLLQRSYVDGRVLIVFDNFIEETGKIMIYESDQICDLAQEDFEAWCKQHGGISIEQSKEFDQNNNKKVFRQVKGCITDSFGRDIAYICSRSIGLTNIKKEDATIISVKHAKMLLRSSHYAQKTGISELVCSINDIEVIKDIEKSTLATLNQASKKGAIHYAKNPLKTVMQKIGGNNLSKLIDDVADGTVTDVPPIDNHRQLNGLKEYTGGTVDVVGIDEKVEVYEDKKPSENSQKFLHAQKIKVGWGQGISDCYALGEVQASYTAFRGGQLMTWAMFTREQKFLERHIVDWVINKFVKYNIKELNPPSNWKNKFLCQWFEMPEVNQLAYQKAVTESLKNGSKNFENIHGVNTDAFLERSKNLISKYGGYFPIFKDVLKDTKTLIQKIRGK